VRGPRRQKISKTLVFGAVRVLIKSKIASKA
jgi:hypothetical protein